MGNEKFSERIFDAWKSFGFKVQGQRSGNFQEEQEG